MKQTAFTKWLASLDLSREDLADTLEVLCFEGNRQAFDLVEQTGDRYWNRETFIKATYFVKPDLIAKLRLAADEMFEALKNLRK